MKNENEILAEIEELDERIAEIGYKMKLVTDTGIQRPYQLINEMSCFLERKLALCWVIGRPIEDSSISLQRVRPRFSSDDKF